MGCFTLAELVVDSDEDAPATCAGFAVVARHLTAVADDDDAEEDDTEWAAIRNGARARRRACIFYMLLTHRVREQRVGFWSEGGIRKAGGYFVLYTRRNTGDSVRGFFSARTGPKVSHHFSSANFALWISLDIAQNLGMMRLVQRYYYYMATVV